jgi:hypothetical protein
MTKIDKILSFFPTVEDACRDFTLAESGVVPSSNEALLGNRIEELTPGSRTGGARGRDVNTRMGRSSS